MATLTDDQLVYLHDHLGADADETDAQDRYDRLGDLDAVIVEMLKRRISDLSNTPAQFSVSGEYSQNTSENLKALQTKLADFKGGLSTVRIVKPAARPCR